MPPKKTSKKTKEQEGSLPDHLIDDIIEYGGLVSAIAWLRVSHRCKVIADPVKSECMPPGLRHILTQSEVTQGILAKALALSEDKVRSEPHYTRQRQRFGFYRIFETTSCVRRLIQKNGGLIGLVERFEKKRKRQVARAAPKNISLSTYGAPPADRIDDWIKISEAKTTYTNLPAAYFKGNEIMPLILRPGSTSARANKGFWKLNCRKAQIFCMLDSSGVDANMRNAITAPGIRNHLENDPLFTKKTPLNSIDEDQIRNWVVPYWLAAYHMAMILPPVIADKYSLLEPFMALSAHATHNPVSIKDWKARFARSNLPCVETILSESDQDIRRGMGMAFLFFILNARQANFDTLTTMCENQTFLYYLQPEDIENLKDVFPTFANAFDHFEEERTPQLRLAILRAARLSPDALGDNMVYPNRRRLANQLIQHALRNDSGRGGLTREETLSNLYKLVTQSSEQRRNDLRNALRSRGCSLRSDSSFCNSYISGTTIASLDEVVATMRITKHLFGISHIAWSNHASEMESEMRERAEEFSQRGWHSAADYVIRNVNIDADDYSYESYGGRYGRECWDCGGPFPCYACGRY